MRRSLLAAVFVCLFCGLLPAQEDEEPPMNPPYPAPLAMLGDEFMLSFFRFSPTAATRAGVHDPYDYKFDAQMDDLSREHILAQIEDFKRLEKRFEMLDPANWPAVAVADREMMIARANAAIFDLETMRWWENAPDRYSQLIHDAVFVLAGRDFAPQPVRLASLVERERKIPQVVAAAKANLKNPPRVSTELAIRQLPGIISFIEQDVPAAFGEVRDAKLLAEFRQANAGAVAALRDYMGWLNRDLLPRSKGDFRLGAERFRKKLLYEEMVDIPLDRLRQLGHDDLQRNQRELKRVAALIEPNKSPKQMLAKVDKEHPAADGLLEAVRQRVVSLRAFLDQKPIITTPSNDMPVVRGTPAFPRLRTTASIDLPGPFEEHAGPAVLNVTLPRKDWTRQRSEEYLAGFSYPAINTIAIRESFPGHFEQYLWTRRERFRIRKFLSLDLSAIGMYFAECNREGWARYSEQMILDEGLGRTPQVAERDDLAFLKLRLVQLRDALLRDAHYLVAIEMHTGNMSVAQATKFFMKQGYQARATASEEALRATADSTSLTDTLGKLQILRLREARRQQLGGQFNLREFHNRVMEQGIAPMSVIRRAVLGEAGPTL